MQQAAYKIGMFSLMLLAVQFLVILAAAIYFDEPPPSWMAWGVPPSLALLLVSVACYAWKD